MRSLLAWVAILYVIREALTLLLAVGAAAACFWLLVRLAGVTW